MKDYKESLIDALDIVKDSKRCLGCVGNCIECEYDKALDQIENAIERLGELVEDKPLDFEELKEGMWIWDNVLKEYIHILTIDFGVPSGGLIETENEYVPLEEGRFYRKQVEE